MDTALIFKTLLFIAATCLTLATLATLQIGQKPQSIDYHVPDCRLLTVD